LVSDEKVKVLYIAGFGRSGSTILGNVLGEIEGFFHGGELNFIWEHGFLENRLCGCGAPFGECGVWTSVTERTFGGMDGAGTRAVACEMGRLQDLGARTRHVPPMLSARGRRVLSSRLEKYTDCVERLYQAIRESTGSRVIVDSSKMPSYGYALGMAPDVELYVVHLIRDPRAAAYSWLKEPRPDADKRSYMNRVNIAKSSLLWDAWNVSSEALWKGSHSRYMRLRYEDFVAEPRLAVEGILDMLGERPDRLPFLDEHEVELGVGHTVAGNPNRFRNGPVRLRPDEEWTYRMRTRDRKLVTLMTLPLLVRYGYPVTAGKAVAA
jgi:hypothetical protein